ncbi:MAG: OB-fold domain-containing protein [Chloroflexi bacterium]|nr:OB-fold domain-containing protein [Chloroflexota bacterium]
MAEYKGMNIFVAPNDHEHLGLFKAARQHKLVVQKCADCGRLRGHPGRACPFCTSLNWDWQEVSGKGTIYSYEIVTQATRPAFRDWVPYPVVLVELDEQRQVPWQGGLEGHTVSLRMAGNLVKADNPLEREDEERVAIGQRVKVVFVDLDDELGLVQWALSGEPPEHTPWRAPV